LRLAGLKSQPANLGPLCPARRWLWQFNLVLHQWERWQLLAIPVHLPLTNGGCAPRGVTASGPMWMGTPLLPKTTDLSCNWWETMEKDFLSSVALSTLLFLVKNTIPLMEFTTHFRISHSASHGRYLVSCSPNPHFVAQTLTLLSHTNRPEPSIAGHIAVSSQVCCRRCHA
jgi:hypothetical protein